MGADTRTVTAIGVEGRPSDVAATKPGVREKAKAENPADLYAPPATRFAALFGYLLVGVVLYAGWFLRDWEYLVAESGPGYYLGIAGGVMMALLLLYPLRKTARFMRNWGATKHWFRAHMVMGVMGPVLIMFHSNFHAGSMNSTVALVSMLLVAGSGFVGRHIYTRIHYGLYGRRMTLKELKTEVEVRKNALAQALN